MRTYHDLTGVVQAGGQSRRMGQDKALMELKDRPLILYPIHALEDLTDTVMIITNNPEDYQFLERPMVRDLLPGKGALGGLYTALSASRTPLVATVACDMPFVNRQLLVRLYQTLHADPELAFAMPRSDHGLEPLHAIYRRELCLHQVEKALYREERRMISWHGLVKSYILEPAEVRQIDPDGLAFINLNTPEEFEQIKVDKS